jgi:hypothetical protein
MRKVAYVLLFIFLLLASFAALTVAMGARAAQSVTQPIGDLVRQLVVPATPVVLPSASTIVLEMRELARLETASYSMQKVITADRDRERLWGLMGEQLIFIAQGEVIAGVDLQRMQVEDLVVVDPTTVMIYLPDAEIFVATLDNENSQVVDRRTGLLARPDPQLETLVRQTAEREILEAALAAGVLDRANENAERFMRSFLQGLGFTNVIFTPDTPPPAPPFQQELPKGQSVTPVAP